MDLVLVRHARPIRVENTSEPADPHLTDLGNRQAEAMAEWLAVERFDALYVSPMLRARQTATPLEKLTGLEAGVIDGVKEYDAEEPHYIPMEDIKADPEQWRRFLAENDAADMSTFSRVVVAALEDLIGGHRGQRIAVVCHGGVVNIWAAHVLGAQPKMFFNPDYTSISRFAAASSGERSIISLNETAHLRSVTD